ncbi:light-harvesting protein [Sandarakinorhabdus sp.]|uniref:light-harvesting protein n=1 Tax=Sandarakinorhabdus sp. TaxID=1916663 RepID=UPI00334266ED
MNEGRIWLYVNPSIGLPLFFLVWVAGTALMVHLAVLNNTTWYKEFLQGGAAVAAAPAVAGAPAADAMAPAAEPAAAEAAPAEAAPAQ